MPAASRSPGSGMRNQSPSLYRRFTDRDGVRARAGEDICLVSSFRIGSGRRSGQRFDAQHGVVTEALIFLGELDPDAIGDALDDATHYEPTPIAQFETMMERLALPFSTFTFVDAGAGMGRVVLLASLRPFKQVIGVEVSPALCETARDNIVRWRRSHAQLGCKDVRIACQDAAAFRFPPGDLLVYLYNPFGEDSVGRLADRLAARAGGDCYVLYHTPVHRAVFDSYARFELVDDLAFGAIYRTR